MALSAPFCPLVNLLSPDWLVGAVGSKSRGWPKRKRNTKEAVPRPYTVDALRLTPFRAGEARLHFEPPLPAFRKEKVQLSRARSFTFLSANWSTVEDRRAG